VYKEKYFHGFARHSDAVELLKGRPGYFLVRYSESQLREGYFAFNVNKGNRYRDVIENYSLPHLGDVGCFVFRDRQYKTLENFVADPDYCTILINPLEKVIPETVKESKYKNPTDF